jgi:putative ABC transport system substrate-binding protein
MLRAFRMAATLMELGQLRRRGFITLLGGAAAWPLVARAQQPNQIARIGYLSQESAAFDRSHGDSAAFRDALGDLGYVEGRNLHIEFRYADADLDRLPALAAELVGLNVDIIVTYSVGTDAARRVTATIPIVQAVGSDLVAAGFARSLARPGGNVTGSTFFNSELMAKGLEVLKEILPSMTRAGVVRNHPATRGMLEAMASAAQALNVAIQPIEVGEPGEFDNASWRICNAGSRVLPCQFGYDRCARRQASAAFDWAARIADKRRVVRLRSEVFRFFSPRRLLRG